MKKRYPEEQIIGFLREAEGAVPHALFIGRELLPLAEYVRRDGRAGCEALEGSRERERAAEEAACVVDAGARSRGSFALAAQLGPATSRGVHGQPVHYCYRMTNLVS